MVLFVIAAIFGLVVVVVIDSILMTQEVEAKGCRTSVAVNASLGRCVKQ